MNMCGAVKNMKGGDIGKTLVLLIIMAAAGAVLYYVVKTPV